MHWVLTVPCCCPLLAAALFVLVELLVDVDVGVVDAQFLRAVDAIVLRHHTGHAEGRTNKDVLDHRKFENDQELGLAGTIA